MGATCSSCCCWSERRVNDVVQESTLQDKLLDDKCGDDYDNNSTLIEDDAPGNPFTKSWPHPEPSPSSVYTRDNDDDDETYNDDGNDQSDRGSEEVRSSTSTSVGHAWNLRAAEPTNGSFVHADGRNNDSDDAARRSTRIDSAAESVRSSNSDSYASAHNLPTYESQLFADDIQQEQQQQPRDSESDNGFGDDDDASASRVSTSAFSEAHDSSSASDKSVRKGRKTKQKRKH